MSRPRFQTATVHGDLTPREGNYDKQDNACAYVYDLASNRIVASFPTERENKYGGGTRRMISDVEQLAEKRCAELNAQEGER